MKTIEHSERHFKILSALAIVVLGCLCWNGVTSGHARSAPANQNPQLQEVVKLTQAKMSDDVILQYIKNSGATYNLSADDILYLNSQGVSQAVISALLASKGSAPAPTPTPVAPPSAPPAPTPQVATPSTPPPPISEPPVSPYPGAAAPAPVVSADDVAPPPGSDITLGYFQTQLAPFGSWVPIPGQGLCWVPSIQSTVPDWRPYFNGGHWEYTDEGTTWVSDYPWGQYVFHYGRWFRDPAYGWVWRPGYHWGPGWVSWRYAEGEGYCGWAPLPPGTRYDPTLGIVWNGSVAVDTDFGLAPDMYVYIPFGDFWMHDYVGFRAPAWRVPVLFRASILANHWGFVGGHFFFGGFDRARLGLFTHHDVVVVGLSIHDDHILRGRAFDHDHFGGRGFDHGYDHGHDFGHDHFH